MTTIANPRVMAAVLAALLMGSLFAQEPESQKKEIDDAVARLSSGDRSAVVAAKITLNRIAHQAARPGAGEQRGRIARILADAYRKTDLVEPRNVLAEILSLVGGRESVPALASALSNPGAREMARFALIRIPAPEAATALRDALKAEVSAEFRVALINALGARRDPLAVDLLALEAQREDLEVRLAALEALSRIPQVASETRLVKPGSSERWPPAGDPLRAREHTRVFDSLMVLGESWIASGKSRLAVGLYQGLRRTAGDQHEKCAALIGLGKAGGEEAAAALEAALRDPSVEIRAAATQGLIAMPGAQGLEALGRGIAEAAPPLRAKLVEGLVYRKEPAAAELAAPRLRDADPAVRAAALAALEGRSDPRVAAALLTVIRLNGPAAREGAVGVLARLPGEAATRAILEAARSAQGEERAAFLRALGQREDPGAVPVLVESARSDSAAVRAAAYEGLGRLRAREALPVLLAGLDRGGENAAAAERALGRLVAPEATQAIARESREKKGAARVALLRILGKREGPEALAPLLDAARDPDEAVRVAALEGLSGQRDPAVLTVLLEAAENGPEKVRPAAVLGCLRFGRMIEEKDRQAALNVYQKALAIASGSEEKGEAIDGMGRLADPSSLAVIKPVLGAKDAKLQRQAAAAMIPIALKLGDDRKDEAVEVLKAALPLAPSSAGARAGSEALRRFGVDYDLARESGFITHWWLLGPLPEQKFEGDPLEPDAVDPPAGGELKVGEKTLRWKLHHTPDLQGIINLEEAVGRQDNAGAYAYAEVTAPAEKRVSLKIGSDDSVVVWLNGKKIHGVEASRGLTVDQDNVNTRLAAGKNRILVKVLNAASQWAFCVRITDRQGVPERLQEREK